MKKYYSLLVVIIVCICTGANAQVYKKKSVHAGENIASISTYLFPSFTDATVKLRNGGTLVSKMNFNLLLCEMQFINPQNDTLVLTKLADIDSIVFSNSVFFFNDGYYEIIASSGSVDLAVLRKATFGPVKIGALGLPNSSGAGIQSYTSVVTDIGERNLVVNEDIEITSETAYFLINNNTEIIKANKAGFSKSFPPKEQDIQTYLKQNKTEFNKEADLEKLFAYCTTQ